MDNRARKQKLKQWKSDDRKAAREALPISAELLKGLFDRLDSRLPIDGCDRTRRLTREWLESNGLPIDSVFAWLDENGGFCDCEVLANSEERFLYAIGDSLD